MVKFMNKSCLQKPKAQTRQYIPNRPSRSLIIKGKDDDGRVINLKGKRLDEVKKFIDQEDREISRKFIKRYDCTKCFYYKSHSCTYIIDGGCSEFIEPQEILAEK